MKLRRDSEMKENNFKQLQYWPALDPSALKSYNNFATKEEKTELEAVLHKLQVLGLPMRYSSGTTSTKDSKR